MITLKWKKNLWPATECHWSDTEEGHSCCARRLECKSGQGCLWKLLANTFGSHKASRRWTWHSPNGQHQNKTDYILVQKRFWSGVNIARTQSFPEADIGSDHNLLIMTFPISSLSEKESASKNTHNSSFTSKSWKIPMCWKPSKLW